MDTDFSDDVALPLEFGVFEVQDEADVKLCDFELADHLGDLVVANFFDDLRINNDGVEGEEIGDVLTHVDGLVDDGEPGLLLLANVLLPEFNHRGIFIWFFQQPMPQRIEHLERTTDDPVSFFFEQKLGRHLSRFGGEQAQAMGHILALSHGR